MQRDHWMFEFPARRLADAASKKKAHHEDRLAFWEKCKAKVLAEVRDTGIEVDEGAAGGEYLPHSNSTRGGPRVMVRNDLQDKLTECHRKLQEHAARIREYAGWVQVFEANPEKSLPLNADDYLFFFGGA